MSAIPSSKNTAEELPPHVVEWRTTWHDFNRALRSPQPFDHWLWIRQLITSSSRYLYGSSGLEQYHVKQSLHSILPAFCMSLLAVIWWSYISSLRPSLRRQSWCGDDCTTCTLDTVHTLFASYLIVMILWHFLFTCFSSPGVALPKDSYQTYKARDAQGGFCCFHPPFDAHAERKRVALYGTLEKRKVVKGKPSLDTTYWEYPTTNPSYCEKCDIVRPPRCHHCKVCNRCTLQVRDGMQICLLTRVLAFTHNTFFYITKQSDHHCPWLNNCIGLNNYRSFLLLITYVLLATGYGVGLLISPFYKTIRMQVQEHGFKYFYKHGTGFLDIPLPGVLWNQAWTTDGIDGDTMVRMIFPLLAIIFGIMLGFWAVHVYYVLTARTTLEHTIMLYIMKDALKAQAKEDNGNERPLVQRARNPFHQGWKRNIYQVFGPNILLVLLPVPVTPLPPYIPKQKKD